MDGDIKQKSFCPVCGEKTDPADLITEDDDYSWVL